MLIDIDYSLDSRPRYGYGKPAHAQIHRLLSADKTRYAHWVNELTKFAPELRVIREQSLTDDRRTEPHWENGFLSPLDASMLYTFVASKKPQTYLEIGSGNSTKFAHFAISKHCPRTRLLSIDPNPRADIDGLCSEVIRFGLEDCDLSCFDALPADTIVFFDGSHRSFMGSDVTIFFLEVLPRLKKGTVVHIHDILLPFDYFPEWKDRYYSEQYLLAAYLMGGSKELQIEFPAAFVASDPDLSAKLFEIQRQMLPVLIPQGGSFWMSKI